jgi:hypothetical protein
MRNKRSELTKSQEHESFPSKMVGRTYSFFPFIRRIVEFIDQWDDPNDIISQLPILLIQLLATIIILPFYLVALLSIGLDQIRWESKTATSTNYTISKAPGINLLALVDFLFSPKTVEQTFKPLVADWRTEYFEALKQGRTKKARWISMRYRYSFIMAMSLSKVFSLLKQIRSVSK